MGERMGWPYVFSVELDHLFAWLPFQGHQRRYPALPFFKFYVPLLIDRRPTHYFRSHRVFQSEFRPLDFDNKKVFRSWGESMKMSKLGDGKAWHHYATFSGTSAFQQSI